MAANQVGHPCPHSCSRQCGAELPCRLGPAWGSALKEHPTSEPAPTFISRVRELGLVRQLCYGQCLQQLGVCLCAPSFQGLGPVTASWHVLFRPWSPGETAALHTHLSLTTSCSILTSPMAAP